MDQQHDGPIEYDLAIDRDRYEAIIGLLTEFHVSGEQLVQEFCFIVLYIEGELKAFENRDSTFGKYYGMWNELRELQGYLLSNRVTEIRLGGETAKDKPGEPLIIRDEVNIDRICDGLRAIFRKEFQENAPHKTLKVRTDWKRRKMGLIKNNIMKYLDSIPKLDKLSIEAQFYIIGKLAALAGFYRGEKEFDRIRAESKVLATYREYLVQKVKALR